MQGALEALFDDLAPEKIDSSIESDRGLGALVGSRKAKLWDTYVERWRAKTKRSERFCRMERMFESNMAGGSLQLSAFSHQVNRFARR